MTEKQTMPRNKTMSELWPSKKDPSYICTMGTQKLEEEVGRRERYSLREMKVMDYREKEEIDAVENNEAPEDIKVNTDTTTPVEQKTKMADNPDVICPVCWSSLVEGGVEVFSLGCGHLVCGECGEGVSCVQKYGGCAED